MDWSKKKKTDNYLVHHGILGQKWGVRRYQNPDGTLTAEGKIRYSNENVYKDLISQNKKGLSSDPSKNLGDVAVRMRVTNDQLKKYKDLERKSLEADLTIEEEDEMQELENSGKTNTKRYKELYKQQDNADRAYKEWSDYYKDIAKQIIGKYASEPVTMKIYGQDVDTNGYYLVSKSLDRLSAKKL